MHKKKHSYLINSVCLTFILGAQLNFLLSCNWSIAHLCSGKGEDNMKLDAQKQLIFFTKVFWPYKVSVRR